MANSTPQNGRSWRNYGLMAVVALLPGLVSGAMTAYATIAVLKTQVSNLTAEVQENSKAIHTNRRAIRELTLRLANAQFYPPDNRRGTYRAMGRDGLYGHDRRQQVR